MSDSGLTPATRTEAEARAELSQPRYFAAAHGFERRPDILRAAGQRSAPEFVASFRDQKDRDEFLRRFKTHNALVTAAESALVFANHELELRKPSGDPEYIACAQKAVDDLTAALKAAKGEA